MAHCEVKWTIRLPNQLTGVIIAEHPGTSLVDERAATQQVHRINCRAGGVDQEMQM